MGVTIGLNQADWNGVLMYVVYKGLDTEVNTLISNANQVWADHSDHEKASQFGVAETDVVIDPNADILKVARIRRYPTLLFVRVEDNKASKLLNRIEGAASYDQISREYLRLLGRRRSNEEGEGSGDPDLIESDGPGGGWGLGLGTGAYEKNCPPWMPSFMCKLPIWLWILIAILIFFLIKRR